ncbi:hypothetical protein TNCT_643471 [Trichonephila clavata]|uniref:Uncharacterized protein n=1 Tax=Trichonephila clavata TaxID=2740835 RepID=A0A8X6KH87_TRICU|nr:hypothetical protein TNCT_643471 [Trichonephila clavata]
MHTVDQNPGISVRALAFAIERSRTTVHHVLKGKVLYPFIIHKWHLFSQFITHDVSRLHRGLLIKVRQTCTLPVPYCPVMKQPFHIKGCSIRTTRTCEP